MIEEMEISEEITCMLWSEEDLEAYFEKLKEIQLNEPNNETKKEA